MVDSLLLLKDYNNRFSSEITDMKEYKDYFNKLPKWDKTTYWCCRSEYLPLSDNDDEWQKIAQLS